MLLQTQHTRPTAEQEALSIKSNFRISEEDLAKMIIIARHFKLPIPLITITHRKDGTEEPCYHQFIRSVLWAITNAWFAKDSDGNSALKLPSAEMIDRLILQLKSGSFDTSPVPAVTIPGGGAKKASVSSLLGNLSE